MRYGGVGVCTKFTKKAVAAASESKAGGVMVI